MSNDPLPAVYSSYYYVIITIITIKIIWLACANWNVTNSTFSPGSKRFVQFNSTASCQTACLTLFNNCIAIEVSRNPVECWIHLGNNLQPILDTQIKWPGIDQYLPEFVSCNYSKGELETDVRYCFFMLSNICRIWEKYIVLMERIGKRYVAGVHEGHVQILRILITG